MESLLIGMIAGVFGVAYFIYGKKQQKFTPMIAGALLCVYPYFVESALWSPRRSRVASRRASS